MKAKIVIILLTGLIFISGLCASNAIAGTWLKEVTINSIGPGSSSQNYVYVQLSKPGSFQNRWFIIDPRDKTFVNRILAIALSAMTNGNKVEVQLNGLAQYSWILNMYLMSQ